MDDGDDEGDTNDAHHPSAAGGNNGQPVLLTLLPCPVYCRAQHAFGFSSQFFFCCAEGATEGDDRCTKLGHVFNRKCSSMSHYASDSVERAKEICRLGMLCLCGVPPSTERSIVKKFRASNNNDLIFILRLH